MDPFRIAIVLPCFNPNPQWENTIIEKYNSLHSQIENAILQFVIVNDGSSLGLTKEIEFLKSRIPGLIYIQFAQNIGKGHAIRSGLRKIKANLYLYTDIDFPYTEASMLNLIENLRTGKYDVAIGVRGEEYAKKLPYTRRCISYMLKTLNKSFFKLITTDTQAGLKGFNQSGCDLFLQTKTDRFLVDLEFIKILSSNMELKSSLEPVFLRDGIRFSQFNYRILMREFSSFLKLLRSE